MWRVDGDVLERTGYSVKIKANKYKRRKEKRQIRSKARVRDSDRVGAGNAARKPSKQCSKVKTFQYLARKTWTAWAPEKGTSYVDNLGLPGAPTGPIPAPAIPPAMPNPPPMLTQLQEYRPAACENQFHSVNPGSISARGADAEILPFPGDKKKNESLAKKSRREVALLLEQGKIETAKIRTESLILQDAHNELLELLELYLELILARFGLLETASPSSKEPDEGVREAICAVVYSAQRTEIRELHAIREALMQRFGRDWALSVMEGASGVSNRITNKLSTKTPDNDWVDMYLYEIAKAYQVDWKPEGLAELETTISDKDGESSTAAQEERLQEAALSTPHTSQPAGPSDDNDGPSTALPTAPSSIPSLKDVRSSTSHVPIVHSPPTGPSASDTSLGSTTTLPSIPPTDPDEASHTVIIRSNLGTTAPQRSAAVSKSQDSKFDDLTKRFEALKRR
ncbi:Vacuolar protein sorting-associated protein ist1 [Cystobasidiomycetes sp. EMM_F5]